MTLRLNVILQKASGAIKSVPAEEGGSGKVKGYEWWFFGAGGDEFICPAVVSVEDMRSLAFALRDKKNFGLEWIVAVGSVQTRVTATSYTLDVFDDGSLAIARQSPDPAGLFYSPGEFSYENYHQMLVDSVSIDVGVPV